MFKKKPGTLGDVLQRKVMKGSPRTLGGSTQEMAKDILKNSHHSKKKAAERAGVSTETFRRWLKGSQEAKDLDALEQAQRAARVKPRNAQKFASSARAQEEGGERPPRSGGMLRVKATIRWSSDQRTRWLDVGGEIPYGKLDHVMDLMITTGPEAAGEALTGLIQEYYFGSGDAQVVSVEDIRW